MSSSCCRGRCLGFELAPTYSGSIASRNVLLVRGVLSLFVYMISALCLLACQRVLSVLASRGNYVSANGL